MAVEKTCVSFETALTQPALLLKREPKAMLLLVPTWLVSLALFFIASGFLSDFAPLFEPGALRMFFESDPNFGSKLLSFLFPYLLPALLVAMFAIAVGSFVSLCYVGIAVQQAGGGKQISLVKAVQFGRKNFFDYVVAVAIALGVALVVSVAVILFVTVVVALIGLAFSAGGFLPGLLFGVVLGIAAAAVVAGAVLLASFSFWLLPAVVALTQARGFEAVKKSAEYSKQRFLHFLAAGVVLVALNLLFSQVAALFSELPLIGFALSQLVLTPFSAWSLMLPPTLFMEYFGGEMKN